VQCELGMGEFYCPDGDWEMYPHTPDGCLCVERL
jgi:hypothetical protein